MWSANVRIRNEAAPGTEGGFTTCFLTDEVMPIYDAAMKYEEADVDTVIFAGKEYGTGSSRDWAAKGTYLLGAKAVIAESFERIHRSNLVGMGVLPVQLDAGTSWRSLGLTGSEKVTLEGINDQLQPRQRINISAVRADGTEVKFSATVRLDSHVEVDYIKNGGILQMVLRTLMKN